jgi:hypothetical protein
MSLCANSGHQLCNASAQGSNISYFLKRLRQQPPLSRQRQQAPKLAPLKLYQGPNQSAFRYSILVGAGERRQQNSAMKMAAARANIGS